MRSGHYICPKYLQNVFINVRQNVDKINYFGNPGFKSLRFSSIL